LSGDDLLRFLYFDLPWVITGPIWRKAALARIGPLDESLPSWQDVDLHVRALASGARYLRFLEVDHHIRWQYEPDKTSIAQRRSPAHLQAAVPLLEKFERLVKEGPGLTWVRQRALCSLYFFLAENWLEVGDRGAALRAWRRVRERGLAPASLHYAGAAMLLLSARASPLRDFAGRLTHKWKGWARLRLNPELV
jgi:hypothetical protein